MSENLGSKTIKCKRKWISVQTSTGYVDVEKGENKEIPLGALVQELEWFCKDPDDAAGPENETAPGDKDFNRVVLFRHPDSRNATLTFFRD